MPGSPKMDSVMTAPASSPPRSMPKRVRIGVMPARSPCLTTTVRRGRPLARAVRMYGSAIVSIIEPRLWRAYMAAYSTASASQGRSRLDAQPRGSSVSWT